MQPPTYGRVAGKEARRRSGVTEQLRGFLPYQSTSDSRIKVENDAVDAANEFKILKEQLKGRFSATLVSSEGQVIRYNTAKAFSVHGAIYMARGTVMTWRTFLLSILCLSVATALAFVRCPAGYDKDKLWDFCIPALSLSDCMIFASLVAFLLGTFLNTIFNRWWSIRQLLQTVIGRTNDTALMLAAYVAGRTPDEREMAGRIREEVVRYLNLAHALIYKQARAEEGLEDLVSSGLATPEEAARLAGLVGQPACVYTWAAALLREAEARGLVHDGPMMLPLIQQNISLMRGAAADVFMFLDTQIPYGYVYIMAALTRVHLLFTMLYTTGLIGAAIDAKSASKVLFAVIFQWSNVTLYESILHLGYEMEDPLGFDSQDFPIQLYKAKLLRSSAHILSLARAMPFRSWLPPATPYASSRPASPAAAGPTAPAAPTMRPPSAAGEGPPAEPPAPAVVLAPVREASVSPKGSFHVPLTTV